MSAGRLSSIFSSRLVGLLALGFTGAALSAGCAIENSLVDGECADGYQLCNGVCVDVLTEAGNCGACGNVCLGGKVCIAGACGVPGTDPGTSTPPAGDSDGGSVGPGDTAQDGGPRSPRGDAAVNGDSGSASDSGGNTSDAGGNPGTDSGSPGVDSGSPSVDSGPVSSGDDAATGNNSDASSSADATVTSDAGQPSTDDSGSVSPDAASSSPDAASTSPDAATSAPDAATSAPDAASTSPDAASAPDSSVVTCVAPLVSCQEGCTDLTSDPFNCGVCGHFCPTYICQAGACVGSLPGQFVLVGHDYASSIPVATPQARVLTNTVFGSGSPTVRVLAYSQYAADAAVSGVTSILQGYASATHRQVAITFSSDPTDVPAKLNTTDFDAFLVLDEPSAPPGALGPIGTSWAPVVQAYATAGGTVVVLDGATAPEMPALVTNAGMFLLNTQTSLAPTIQVVNLAPGDSVGNGVESPYLPTVHSAFFGLTITAPQSTTVVVSDPTDSAPVVVQRVLQ
jgi:hypothetical protein